MRPNFRKPLAPPRQPHEDKRRKLRRAAKLDEPPRFRYRHLDKRKVQVIDRAAEMDKEDHDG
jgi:hypothetical protein